MRWAGARWELRYGVEAISQRVSIVAGPLVVFGSLQVEKCAQEIDKTFCGDTPLIAVLRRTISSHIVRDWAPVPTITAPEECQPDLQTLVVDGLYSRDAAKHACVQYLVSAHIAK